METILISLLRGHYSKGAHFSCWRDTQRHTRKGRAVDVAASGTCWLGGTDDGLLRMGNLMWCIWEACLVFSGYSEVEGS